MDKNIPRRHHYIPQYYLRGFCALDSDQIWVYDKSAKKITPFKTGTVNAAVEKDFYKLGIDDTEEDTIAAEQFFADKVEGPVNPIIKRVLAHENIGLEDEHWLAFYLYSMIGRVPAMKERTKRQAPRHADTVRRAAYKKIDSDFSDGTAKKKKFLRELADTIIQKEVDNPSNIHLLPLQPFGIMSIMLQMNWYFMISSDNYFLTCDNPVFLHKSRGLSQGEFTFPIGKNVALWATNRKVYPRTLTYQEAHSQVVKEMNRRTISNATRFVFSSHNESWIANAVGKRDIQIKDYLDR